MKKKNCSAPIRILLAAFGTLAYWVILEAGGAYLVYSGMAGESTVYLLVLLAAGVAALLAAAVFKLHTATLCALLPCAVCGITALVALLLYGEVNVKFFAAIWLSLATGSFVSLYFRRRLSKRKKGRSGRKKK